MKSWFFILVLVGFCAIAASQSVTDSSHEPESGFLSPTRYTNGYFGFLMPVPQNPDLRSFFIPSTSAARFLYGIRTQAGGQSVLSVIAQPARKDPRTEAKEAARTGKKASVKKVTIGDREFWKGEFSSDSPAGRVESMTYAVAGRGYVITFNVLAFDPSLARVFAQAVEAVRFFNPEQAKEVAGPDAKPWNPAHPEDESAPPHSERMRGLSPGRVSSGFYNNDDLGIAWTLPRQWTVTQGANLRGEASNREEDAQASREEKLASECARELVVASPPEQASAGLAVASLTAADPACWRAIRFPASGDQETLQQLIPFLRTVAVAPGSNAQPSLWREPVSGHLLYIVDWSYPGAALHPDTKQSFASITMTVANGYWLVWRYQSPTMETLQALKRTEIAFAKPLGASNQ